MWLACLCGPGCLFLSVFGAIFLDNYSAADKGAEYCDEHVCLSVSWPDLSVWRPWAGSLLEAPTHPQML